VASEHLEQFGEVTGALSIGGSSISSGAWASGPFMGGEGLERPEDVGLAHVPVLRGVCPQRHEARGPGGEVDAGFIHLKGRNVPLVKADIQTEFAEAGPPKR
jgi:hypothetical protein